MKNQLFTPLTLRGVTFRNRIFTSPMCQYSSRDGAPTDWHMVHLGARAVGGAACVIQEATAITPEGRISPADAGIWNDAQVQAYRPIVRFIREQGAVPAIQLAHAGRKASVTAPWDGDKPLAPGQGGWQTVAPSSVPFSDNSPAPHKLDLRQIAGIVTAFAHAAERSRIAGYDVVEIHAAHGYLLHEFLSPLSNRRTDDYGGTLENRMRLILEVAYAVRRVWPDHLPVFVRISASEWVPGGWDTDDSIALCTQLKTLGIDFIDVSSGGNIWDAKIPGGPGYQVPFATTIKYNAEIPTGAVGMITGYEQAAQIISNGQADVVLLAREMLRDPYWPLHAAEALGEDAPPWPRQYARAKKHR